MDVCSVIRQRLDELGLEQKDLAAAADVTESYVSQLLTRKKLPPAPNRTDLYGPMERLLKLPKGKLSDLALAQRREELKAIQKASSAEIDSINSVSVSPYRDPAITASARIENSGR